MAAPSSSQSDSDDDKMFKDVPEYLDWRTPNFDPLRAIYDDRTPIPKVSGVKQFNNIAQFENFLMGKDAQSHKKKKEQKESELKEKMPGIIAERAAAQAKEAVRKAAIMAKNAGPSVRSETQARRNRSSTVFTRMEGYKIGPMSMMRRCVEEKLRVIVVVRAAVAVRSRCRGYIIAFDKHFNMALMDVDEKLIKPVFRKKEKEKFQIKKKAPDCEGKTADRDQESLSRPTQRVSLQSSSMLRESKFSQDPCLKGRHSSKDRVQGQHMKDIIPVHKDLPAKLNPMNPHGSSKRHDLRDQLVSKGLDQSNVPEITKKTEEKRSKDFQDHFRNCLSDSNIYTERQRKKLVDKKTCESDGEIKVESESGSMCKSTDKLQQQYKPFWPLYKKWTEIRCNAEYEIISRHLNQLFIRGDNVVSVSICN